MPLYDYRCPRCDTAFEVLLRPDTTPGCPACGSLEVERVIVSLIAAPARSPGKLRAARSQAALEGHLSNYSSAERSRMK